MLTADQIPYSVTKQEILAFLGRNAKIITPDLGGAVHIIMERSTSKTMDCYVEFFSAGDALAAVNKFMRNRDDGRHPRIGDRHVTVELCGQDALMKELFPRAKNVIWHGGSPSIVESDDPYNSGFKGFVTSEEMVMLVKHAEQPHRVSGHSFEMLVLGALFQHLCAFVYVLTQHDQIVAFQPTLFTAHVRVHDQYPREGIVPSLNPAIHEFKLIIM